MDDGFTYHVFGQDDDGSGVAEAAPNPVREKSFEFALLIIRLFKRLETKKEFIVSKQLLRSGTSVGANVEEATAAESRRDFIHKMTIASKEARESLYWLRLLSKSDLVPGIDVSEELALAHEIVRLLTAIVKSTSQSSKRER